WAKRRTRRPAARREAVPVPRRELPVARLPAARKRRTTSSTPNSRNRSKNPRAIPPFLGTPSGDTLRGHPSAVRVSPKGVPEGCPQVKVATWNVNGIRARAAEVLQWIEREQPDVLCLQEIKSPPESVPEPLCSMAGYWCFWHGHKGYSGVSIHLRKAAFPGRPRFSHPEFDRETRIVEATAGDLRFASCYVPNGGKDFDAKLRFLEGLEKYAAARHRMVLCGDLNVAREERDVH